MHTTAGGEANVEVRGEIPEELNPEVADNELNAKKKVYAAMGMLVPLSKEGVTIRGLLTDESGATTVTLARAGSSNSACRAYARRHTADS